MHKQRDCELFKPWIDENKFASSELTFPNVCDYDTAFGILNNHFINKASKSACLLRNYALYFINLKFNRRADYKWHQIGRARMEKWSWVPAKIKSITPLQPTNLKKLDQQVVKACQALYKPDNELKRLLDLNKKMDDDFLQSFEDYRINKIKEREQRMKDRQQVIIKINEEKAVKRKRRKMIMYNPNVITLRKVINKSYLPIERGCYLPVVEKFIGVFSNLSEEEISTNIRVNKRDKDPRLEDPDYIAVFQEYNGASIYHLFKKENYAKYKVVGSTPKPMSIISSDLPDAKLSKSGRSEYSIDNDFGGRDVLKVEKKYSEEKWKILKKSERAVNRHKRKIFFDAAVKSNITFENKYQVLLNPKAELEILKSSEYKTDSIKHKPTDLKHRSKITKRNLKVKEAIKAHEIKSNKVVEKYNMKANLSLIDMIALLLKSKMDRENSLNNVIDSSMVGKYLVNGYITRFDTGMNKSKRKIFSRILDSIVDSVIK